MGLFYNKIRNYKSTKLITTDEPDVKSGPRPCVKANDINK